MHINERDRPRVVKNGCNTGLPGREPAGLGHTRMSESRNCLILFARYPVAGRVKTRLVPVLGSEGAAALHRRLVLRTLRTACAACQSLPADFEVHFEGGSDEAMRHWLGESARFVSQGEGD